MRTLKNVLFYFSDFLRSVFIKIPVNLIMTKRGRWAALGISAPAILFSGLHFWNTAETIFLPAPNKLEEAVDVIFTKDNIIDANVRVYSSAEEFIKNLKTDGQVLAGYYQIEFKKPGADNKEFGSLAKVYYGQMQNGKAVFLEPFPTLGHDLYNFRALGYDKTGIAMIHGNARDVSWEIWSLGGIFWLLGLIMVLAVNSGF